MSKVIVFGAHGKIGTRLIKRLASTQYKATAVVRNSAQAQLLLLVDPNLATTELTLTDSTVGAIAGQIKGHDAVVVSVGSAGKSLLQVDLDGVVKTFEAAVEAGVRRLVLVSAAYADSREFGVVSTLRDYYIAKHYADRILRAEFSESLDYTILRPLLLTDGPGTGKVRKLEPLENPGTVEREDVAAAIVELLDKKVSYGRSYDFCQGEQPISDAATWQ